MSEEGAGSEQEQRQAEALARALENGVERAPPDDALGTAALLRYSRDAGTLPDDRRDAILEKVFDEARMPTRRARWRWTWLKWLVPAGGLAAAATAAVLLTVDGPRPAKEAARVPVPDTALLHAQADAVRGTEQVARELDRHMNDYRGAVHAALQEHYDR